MKEVEIEALRPFNKTPQGNICEVGERFPVGEARADELSRSGLAKRTGKAAPKPANKMAPEPETKAPATKPITVTRTPAKLSGRG